MKSFRVRVYREWTEYGEISVEAEDEDEARDAAMEALNSDDDGIEWESSNMSPGQQDVEEVREE